MFQITRPRIIIALLFILLLSSITAWQCTNPFAPALSDGTRGNVLLLTNQESPDGVLTNFQYAYTFKDSLVYSELFDSSFTFISWNFNVSPPEPIQWGRDTELRTTGRMFRFFNTLDLTWNVRDTVFMDTVNTPPQLVEEKITFTLTLDGGSTIPTLNGEVLFQFIRRGQKWYIVRWEDLQI
ncbi:MAG: hypothetical protein D6748_00575 [Calditrichaeota bacterium]|nr:MAG: hypothetical protein D6748_00575 [Calditrichota bacterium]